MIRVLVRSLFIWAIRAAVSCAGVLAGGALGFGVGLLAATVIVRLGLGPPAGACGLAGLLLVPAPLTGALAGAIGAAVGRIIKGTLTSSVPIAAVAIPLGVLTAFIGAGDALTRGSTIAIAGTLIGLGTGFVGAIVGVLFVRVDERLSARV
jgi:hypothetical protein